jgi:hypothetical protein
MVPGVGRGRANGALPQRWIGCLDHALGVVRACQQKEVERVVIEEVQGEQDVAERDRVMMLFRRNRITLD